MEQTVSHTIAAAEAALAAAGIDEARLDAEWMLADLLHLGRAELSLRAHDPLDDETQKSFQLRVDKRARRIPLQYVLGWESFRGLRLKVDPRALIPRPETEELVDLVAALPLPAESRVLDLGTGTGCLAIGLGRACMRWRFLAVDVSGKALALAGENVRRHRLGARIRLKRADLFAMESWTRPASFDLLVSNPPYVAESEWETLQPEVSGHEPRQALVAGPEGLDCYRALIPAAHVCVRPRGVLALEIGCDQAAAVRSMAEAAGWRDIRVKRDRHERDRFILATRGEDS